MQLIAETIMFTFFLADHNIKTGVTEKKKMSLRELFF